MLLSAVSVLVVAQSSSEIPEGLMNNPVYLKKNKRNYKSPQIVTHVAASPCPFSYYSYRSQYS